MKILKNKKALSPVVASIILIAVTVAVSIAVAAWMGALTFTFTKTEELKITGIVWSTTYANLTITNTGASDLTIKYLKLDGTPTSGVVDTTTIPATGGTYTLSKCVTTIAKINHPTGSFSAGTKYTFAILTANGNQYEYIATKP